VNKTLSIMSPIIYDNMLATP